MNRGWIYAASLIQVIVPLMISERGRFYEVVMNCKDERGCGARTSSIHRQRNWPHRPSTHSGIGGPR